MTDIVVIGSSGHARVVLDTLEREARARVVGLLDSFRGAGEVCFGYEVLGTEAELPKLFADGVRAAFIAVGDNWQRFRLAERARELVPGLRFVTAVHPSAQLGRDVELGEGSVAMAGAVVNPGSRLGRFSIINTRASLDHDGDLGEFASLAPGVAAGGRVSVGAFSAVGIGAAVGHGRKIGEHTVVGAGAVVVRDIPDHVVAYGAPARVVRRRSVGEPYL
ncbi:MAG: NeuD/PglB/VioB family sugar acetyltransferase [Deferrisomatales bacterium]|nr:NeuD/PglB/VioB family sugar acetyltransferase [Deferrisomatales bacterium]